MRFRPHRVRQHPHPVLRLSPRCAALGATPAAGSPAVLGNPRATSGAHSRRSVRARWAAARRRSRASSAAPARHRRRLPRSARLRRSGLRRAAGRRRHHTAAITGAVTLADAVSWAKEQGHPQALRQGPPSNSISRSPWASSTAPHAGPYVEDVRAETDMLSSRRAMAVSSRCRAPPGTPPSTAR